MLVGEGFTLRVDYSVPFRLCFPIVDGVSSVPPPDSLGSQTLKDFSDMQAAQRDRLEAELQMFSSDMHDAVIRACEDTLYNFLSNAGFNVKVTGWLLGRAPPGACDTARASPLVRFMHRCVPRDSKQDFMGVLASPVAPAQSTLCLFDMTLLTFPAGQTSGPGDAHELLRRIMEEVNPFEVSFTERAAIRTQCRKLAKFIKVGIPPTVVHESK